MIHLVLISHSHAGQYRLWFIYETDMMFAVRLRLQQKDDLRISTLQLQYGVFIQTVDWRITIALPQDTPVLQTQHIMIGLLHSYIPITAAPASCFCVYKPLGLLRLPSPTRLCPSVALITPQRTRLIMACWITAAFWTLSGLSLMSSCCLAPSPSSSSVRRFLRFHILHWRTIHYEPGLGFKYGPPRHK